MRKTSYSRAVLLAAALLAAAWTIPGCAIGPRLRVESVSGQNALGQIPKDLRYDLILYGGRYSEDLYTVAILSIEGTPYRIVPYAPAFDYKVLKNVSAPQAMETVVRFFRNTNPNFMGIGLRQVLGPDGKAIAYEIRPLYQPFVYGFSDVLETSYWVMGKGLVNVWIDVASGVRRDGGSGNREQFEHGR